MPQAVRNTERKVFRVIPTDSIIPNPKQPRKYFDYEELMGLAQSIREIGVIQPLTVCYDRDGLYRLIAGERRLRACKIAGLTAVPCIIIDTDDEGSALMALVENLQRRDLDFFEQASGIHAIITEMGMSQNEMAMRIGKSQAAVANKLRLLRIPYSLQKEILQKGLSERHARALLKLPPDRMAGAVAAAVANDMNIAEFEAYVDSQLPKDERQALTVTKKSPQAKPKGYVGDMRICLNTIEKAVKMLKEAGIDVKGENSDCDDKIVYTITIMK